MFGMSPGAIVSYLYLLQPITSIKQALLFSFLLAQHRAIQIQLYIPVICVTVPNYPLTQ